MENPRSNTSPASGGKRKETAASKKRTVCMHTMIPVCMPIRLDKSYREVSSRSCDVLQLRNIAHHCHFENITDHTNDTEPAMAGRSLDRALKKLHFNHNKSFSSLKNMSSEVIHADNASRPGTPGTEPPVSSAILEQLKGIQNAYTAAKSDNAFLRTLVEQNTKEKAVLVTAVETLQVESKSKLLYI
jgi:hypothetical protein